MIAVDRERQSLRLADCFRIYLPLGLTFMMVSGAHPIVSMGLRRVGDFQAADRALSTYALAFSLSLMLHSPLFVTREIVMTVARDRASWRLVCGFILGIASLLSAVEITLATTPLGGALLGNMTQDAALVPRLQETLLVLAIMPFLIGIRGLNQALLIRGDRSRWVGVGTAGRLLGMAGAMTALVLGAPQLGAVAGAIAFVFGVSIETGIAIATTVRERRELATAPTVSEERLRSLGRFALPLMLGNMTGLISMPLFAAVAGRSDAAAASIAAFALVRTMTITCGAPVFALQAVVTAKGDSPANRHTLGRFALLVGLSLTGVLALLTLPAVADPVFISLLNAPAGSFTYEMAVATLPIALIMPCLSAARATMRGVLIRRRATGLLFASTLVGILVPVLWIRFVGLGEEPLNRADDAFLGWATSSFVESILLAAVVLRGRAEPTSGGTPGAPPAPPRTPLDMSP